MKKILSLALLILLAPVMSLANPIENHFPSDLLYQGKPINPLCLSESNDSSKLVDLNKCGPASVTGFKITQYNSDLLKQGYIGFDYDYHVDKVAEPFHGYSYYKSFGMVKGYNIIYLTNNSGGSGQFSGIYLVKRKGDTLRVTSINGGDRCNGGISAVKRENNQLTYHQNLTSYDLFALASDNPHQLNAYTDLEACAACCVAAVVIKHNLNNFNQEKIMSIDLTPYPIDPKNPPQQGKYQACFNKLLLQAEAGKQSLTLGEVKQMIKTFNSQCVK